LNNDPNYKDLGLSNEEKESKALLTMVPYAIGTIVGALVMGRIVDFFGARKSVLALILIMAFMTSVMFYNICIERFNWITYVWTFLLGCQDSFYEMHVYKILGSEFINKS